jgi:hypothetical protein
MILTTSSKVWSASRGGIGIWNDEDISFAWIGETFNTSVELSTSQKFVIHHYKHVKEVRQGYR